jgi:hypothetical protein
MQGKGNPPKKQKKPNQTKPKLIIIDDDALSMPFG